MQRLCFAISTGADGQLIYQTFDHGPTITHMLQVSQDVFANAILVEFGLNSSNDIVYDRAVDGRLKNFSVT